MLYNCICSNLTLMMPILFGRIVGVLGNLITMIMLAKLGEQVLSASSLIMGVFTFCVVLVFSFSFSLSGFIARSISTKNDDETGAMLKASLLLNTIISIPFFLALYDIEPILMVLHQDHSLASLVNDYYRGFLYAYFPMVWLGVLDQFLLGIRCAHYIFYFSIFSAVFTSFLGYVLIFGKCGLPAMGVFGAGLASSVSVYACLFACAVLFFRNEWIAKFGLFKNSNPFLFFKPLWKMGWPISFQFLGEFFSYTALIFMMGWVSVEALAAQQIIMQFSSLVVMIPSSLSQAATISIAEAYAKHEREAIRYHMISVFFILMMVMTVISIVFIAFPECLINLFLGKDNVDVFQLTYRLLMLSLVTLYFDGIRTVFAGIYRGFQDTKKSMMITLIALWGMGLPLSYVLGLILQFGAEGVRAGYLIGMIMAAGLFLFAWVVERKNIFVL